MSERNGAFLKNIGTIIALGLAVFGLIAQWQAFGQGADLAKANDERLRAHEMDNRRHIDPDRDERRWEELYRRLDRIERLTGR